MVDWRGLLNPLGESISHSIHCSTTGVTKNMVYTVLSASWKGMQCSGRLERFLESIPLGGRIELCLSAGCIT